MNKHINAQAAARFADLCQRPDEAGDEAFTEFIRLFDRAGVSHQIGNPEWIARFYPLLVEINGEISAEIARDRKRAFHAGEIAVYQFA